MKKYQIKWVNLDPTIGHEVKKTRPCLIISPDEMNEHLMTLIVVPLTSVERRIPTRVLIKASAESGLKNDSYAMLDQVKTIDKARITGHIGEIAENEKRSITKALLELFDY